MARPAPDQWQSPKDRDPKAAEVQAAPAGREEVSVGREHDERYQYGDSWEAQDDRASLHPRADNDDVADVEPPSGLTVQAPNQAPRAKGGSHSFGYIVLLIVLALFAASISAALVLIFL